MNKLNELFSKFKYEFGIFTALSLNFLILFTKEDIMSDILYPLHLVDVRIGLISRTLVGSISGLLWEHPTEGNIVFLQILVTVLSFFLIAVFLGGCIKNAKEESGKLLFMLSLVVAVFPYGFMTYINLFELMDIYWLLSAVLCLLAADGKKTAFLVPVLIFTGLWVHYSFLLAFMPLIYVLFFRKCLKEKSRYNYILTGVMVTVSVGSTLYFMLTMRSISTMTFDEFLDYIIDKAGSPITSIERYVGIGFRSFNETNRLYKLTEISEDLPDIVKALVGYFKMALKDTTLFAIICDLLLASPAVAFFEAIWARAMKNTEDKKERFLYFLCLISPLVQLFACFTSSDTSRWLSDMIISCLLMLALFIKDSAAPVTNALTYVTDRLKAHKAPLLFALLIYLSLVFVW